LAFVLTVGPVGASRGKQVVSYFGRNPRKQSSGSRQRLGEDQQAGQYDDALAARGSGPDSSVIRAGAASALLSFQVPTWFQPGQGGHRTPISGEMYWMLRHQKDYAQLFRMQVSPGSGVVDSVPPPQRCNTAFAVLTTCGVLAQNRTLGVASESPQPQRVAKLPSASAQGTRPP
jgi:hypothetical protein